MSTLKTIDPNRKTTFELGHGEDLLTLIIPFKYLKNFHKLVSLLLEKQKDIQPPDVTGVYLHHRGTLKEQP